MRSSPVFRGSSLPTAFTSSAATSRRSLAYRSQLAYKTRNGRNDGRSGSAIPTWLRCRVVQGSSQRLKWVARTALARGGARGSSQGFRQLAARADIELVEHLPQMPFDRAPAQEQLSADLRVGVPVAGEAGDLCLLGRELILRFDAALPYPFAGGQEFAAGP